MANGALCWKNIFLTGELSAGSSLETAPVSNLATAQGAEPWVTAYGVTSSSSGAVIYVDAGAAIDWQAFGLFRTNLSTSATVRYMLGTTSGGSSVLDTGNLSGVVAGRNQHVYVHTSALSAQFLTIEINDVGNPDYQIRVGLAYAGEALIPRLNFGYETARDRVIRNGRAESGGGQVFFKPMWIKRKWDISWSALDPEEVDDYLVEADEYGRYGSNVLFVPDYADNPCYDSIFGEMTEPSPFSFSSGGFNNAFSWKTQIVERL